MKLLAILCVILISLPAGAEQCKKAYHITTPCDGVLVPAQDITLCQQCTDVDLPSTQLELSRTKSLWAIDKQHFAIDLAAEHTYTVKLETLIKSMTAPVATCPKPEWYETPMVVFTAGILVGGAVAGITARLLK